MELLISWTVSLVSEFVIYP